MISRENSELIDFTGSEIGAVRSTEPIATTPTFVPPDEFTTTVSSGKIRLNELLFIIWSYINPHAYSLWAMSFVCRGWRERVSHLPQWENLRLAFESTQGMIGWTGDPHLNLRDRYYQSVCEIRRQREEDNLRQIEYSNMLIEEGKAIVRNRSIMTYVGTLVLNVVLLISAFYVGYGSNDSIGDTLIGIGAFFTVWLLGVLFSGLLGQATSSTYHFAGEPGHRIKSLLVFSLIVSLALCIPVGMAGGRLHSLNALRYAPVLTATCSGPMSTVMDIDKSLGTSAPSYVHIPNTTEWWVQQPFTYTPTSHRTRVYSEITYGLGGCNTSARRWRLFFVIASAYNSTTKTNTTTQYPRRLSDVVNVTGPFDLRTMFSSTYFSNDVGDHYGSTWYDVWMRTRRVYVRSDSASPRTPDEASRQLNDWWWVMYKGIIIVGGVYIFMILWSFLPYGYVLPLMVSLLTFSGIPMIVFGGLCLTDVPYCVLDVGASGTVLAFGIVLCMLVCGVISSAVS